ncbi:MAG: hypothetical protein K8R77_04330 [Anaerolineaceae bacterium]|nr:hypothetical protein [Anaerolineaceae bacterium]
MLEGDQFCANCGQPVTGPASPPAAQSVAPAARKRISLWLLGVLGVLGVIILVSLVLCFGVAYLVEPPPLVEPLPLVETPPLEDNSEGLTPQELAHEGTHTYEGTCIFDESGSEIDFPVSQTYEFVEGGVTLEEAGDDYIPFYPKTGLNTYGGEWEYGIERCSLTFSDVDVRKRCPGEISCIYQRK